MARFKDLEVKATVTFDSGGDVILSVHKLNNFADTVTISIDDTSGSGLDTNTALGLRTYATGKETMPSLSYTPALVQDEEWFVNVEFSSTDGKEKLSYDFTVYADSSANVATTIHLIGKSVKAL